MTLLKLNSYLVCCCICLLCVCCLCTTASCKESLNLEGMGGSPELRKISRPELFAMDDVGLKMFHKYDLFLGKVKLLYGSYIFVLDCIRFTYLLK